MNPPTPQVKAAMEGKLGHHPDPEGSLGSAPPRYAQNAFAWWAHDALVHPLTGTMGLIGRLLRSTRLMALGHHIHNATAPSNDAVADYIEAAARAGHNETAADPYGSKLVEEQDVMRAQARHTLGREPDGWEEIERVSRGTPAAQWNAQADPRAPKPRIVDAYELPLLRARAALLAFDGRSAAEALGCGEHEARQRHKIGPGDPKIRALILKRMALVEEVHRLEMDINRPLTLSEFLKVGEA